MGNILGPPQQVLIARHTLVEASLAADGTMFAGPSGGDGLKFDASEANVGAFDVREFKRLLLIFEGAIANAVTCQFGVLPIALLGGNADYGGFFYLTTPSEGGPLYITAGGVPAHTTTISGTSGVIPFVPPQFKLKFFRSGATGAITGGKIAIYGSS